MAQVISDLCAQVGHTPIAYTSGRRALDLMHSHAPQLIVTDIHMDGVTGMEVLRAARARLPQTPVILITANKQLEMAVEGMRAGAFDYMLIPF